MVIISNHNWHKGLHRHDVDIIGGMHGQCVNAELLKKYDVVITIGRTVQMGLVMGIPVYCYDHFGGPGYITTENIDFNEFYNFSGRQEENNFTEIKVHDFGKIFDDIYSNYEKVCLQQPKLLEIARQRYNFRKNLDTILKDIV